MEILCKYCVLSMSTFEYAMAANSQQAQQTVWKGIQGHKVRCYFDSCLKKNPTQAQDSKACGRIQRPGLIRSGGHVVESHGKEKPLQLEGLDACSCLFPSTSKRPSSIPAIHQRREKSSPQHHTTIFKHLCISSCSHSS